MATVTRDLQCSPAAVLAVLADGWTYATWVVGTSRIRAVESSWPEPGARVLHSFGVWPAVIDDAPFSDRGWRSARIRSALPGRAPGSP